MAPQQLAYAVRDPRDVDADHLKVLAVCHFVAAGLTVLFSCFGLIYVVLGFVMLKGGFANTGRPATMPNPAVVNPLDDKTIGAIFMAFGSVITLLGWTIAACTLYSGVSIRQRRRRAFSIVVAGINCAMFPFGTVLGIFTLMVLLRDSVRQLYEDARMAHSMSGNNTAT